MSKNIAGAKFVSRGIEYVLDYGPKGNLRPYTLGPVKTAVKTRNPYIIGGALALASAILIGLWAWNKCNVTEDNI